MERKMTICHLSIGKPKRIDYAGGKTMTTAIYKEGVTAAYLTKDGFKGDGVADLRNHGGLDRAVCLYPHEHYALWEEELEMKLEDATFGENITVVNMLEKDVHIGDVFRIGEAVIQITQSRIPCSTITKKSESSSLLKRIVAKQGYTGYLARVLQEGIVKREDKFELVEQHPAKISVLQANTLYFHPEKDLDNARKIVEIPELADVWRDRSHSV